jgi:hexulose-6-phosphate isomerase
MKIGLTEVTSGKIGIGLLEHADKLGLTGVEPMIGTVDSAYLSWTEYDFSKFHDQAQRFGITVPTAAVGLFNAFSGLVDPKQKNVTVDIIKQSLVFAQKIKAEIMLLCTFFASKPDTPQKEANFLEILRDVMPFAEKCNVKIGLESPLHAELLINQVDQINSKYLGVYYDVGNSVFLGYDPAEEIVQLGSRIIALHIKDSINNFGDAHLGMGKLDLQSCMKNLHLIDYSGWFMLETPRNNDKMLIDDINLLKTFSTNIT